MHSDVSAHFLAVTPLFIANISLAILVDLILRGKKMVKMYVKTCRLSITCGLLKGFFTE